MKDYDVYYYNEGKRVTVATVTGKKEANQLKTNLEKENKIPFYIEITKKR